MAVIEHIVEIIPRLSLLINQCLNLLGKGGALFWRKTAHMGSEVRQRSVSGIDTMFRLCL
jgi:hypothetical protein